MAELVGSFQLVLESLEEILVEESHVTEYRGAAVVTLITVGADVPPLVSRVPDLSTVVEMTRITRQMFLYGVPEEVVDGLILFIRFHDGVTVLQGTLKPLAIRVLRVVHLSSGSRAGFSATL